MTTCFALYDLSKHICCNSSKRLYMFDEPKRDQ